MGADRDRMPGETGGASGPDRDPGEGDRCIRTLPPAHTRASVSRTGEMRTRGRDAFGTSAAVMPRRDGRGAGPYGSGAVRPTAPVPSLVARSGILQAADHQCDEGRGPGGCRSRVAVASG